MEPHITVKEEKPEIEIKNCSNSINKRQSISRSEKSVKKAKLEQKYGSSDLKTIDKPIISSQHLFLEKIIFQKQKEFFNSSEVIETLQSLINEKRNDCCTNHSFVDH